MSNTAKFESNACVACAPSLLRSSNNNRNVSNRSRNCSKRRSCGRNTSRGVRLKSPRRSRVARTRTTRSSVDLMSSARVTSKLFKPSLRYDYPLSAPNTVSRPIRDAG